MNFKTGGPEGKVFLLCKEQEGGVAGSYADWRATQQRGKRFPQVRLF